MTKIVIIIVKVIHMLEYFFKNSGKDEEATEDINLYNEIEEFSSLYGGNIDNIVRVKKHETLSALKMSDIHALHDDVIYYNNETMQLTRRNNSYQITIDNIKVSPIFENRTLLRLRINNTYHDFYLPLDEIDNNDAKVTALFLKKYDKIKSLSVLSIRDGRYEKGVYHEYHHAFSIITINNKIKITIRS